MKTRIVLLAFLLSAFISCYGQYEPATPKDTVEGFYTEGEIRRFLLTQEKGSPVWKFARQSRTSNTVGVTTLAFGSVCVIAGAMGLANSTSETIASGILETVSYATLGVGLVNVAIGVWQLDRSGRKLEQAKKLYYGD